MVWNDRDDGQGSKIRDTVYVYDDCNLVAELDANDNNSRLRTYLWGLDLSGTVSGAGGVGGLLGMTYFGISTTNCFSAFDGNGNLCALIDAADGKSVAQYEYGPFGEVIRMTGPMAQANSLRFSTKYQDDETDMLYYGYRYYSADTGRWLSRDPIEEWGALNLYEFVRNNPINFVDLFGLQDKDPIPNPVIPPWWPVQDPPQPPLYPPNTPPSGGPPGSPGSGSPTQPPPGRPPGAPGGPGRGDTRAGGAAGAMQWCGYGWASIAQEKAIERAQAECVEKAKISNSPQCCKLTICGKIGCITGVFTINSIAAFVVPGTCEQLKSQDADPNANILTASCPLGEDKAIQYYDIFFKNKN